MYYCNREKCELISALICTELTLKEKKGWGNKGWSERELHTVREMKNYKMQGREGGSHETQPGLLLVLIESSLLSSHRAWEIGTLFSDAS